MRINKRRSYPMKKLFALLLTLALALSVCAFASAEEPVTITF